MADEDVLGYIEFRETQRLLVDEGDARFQGLARTAEADFFAVEVNFADSCLVNPGEHFGEAGFSGPILARNCMDLSPLQREIDGADDIHAAKRDGDRLRFNRVPAFRHRGLDSTVLTGIWACEKDNIASMQPPPPITPPPGYGEYYRPGAHPPGGYYGSPERLKALADGYFALNWAFLATIILYFAVFFAFGAALGLFRSEPNSSGPNTPAPELILLPYVIVGLCVAGLSYWPNKRIAFGMDWKPVSAVFASLLVGLVSVICCGILGFVIMQQIAYGEMKKYGLRAGFFSMTKRKVLAMVEEQIRLKSMPPPVQAPIPPSTEGPTYPPPA